MPKINPEALKRYKKFHGRLPERIGTITLPTPSQVVFVGKGIAVEYASDKKLHPKDKRIMRGYRHLFGAGVKFYTDPKGKVLYVLGGRFRITDWMRD